MIRSLYSGVSGMTNHQTKMDVIGNNIANVNTYGYKSSSAIFKDVYYQMAKAPTAGTLAAGGNSPGTVGYGVQLAGIVKDMTPSNFMVTFQTLDLAISGDGFFITAQFPGMAGTEASPNPGPSNVTYTRMGAMEIDSFGNLVANNRFLLGTRNSMAGLQATGTTSLNLLDNAPGPARASDMTFTNTININQLIRDAYSLYTDANGFLYTFRQPDGTIDEDRPLWADETGNPMVRADVRAAVERLYNGFTAAAEAAADVRTPGDATADPPVPPGLPGSGTAAQAATAAIAEFTAISTAMTDLSPEATAAVTEFITEITALLNDLAADPNASPSTIGRAVRDYAAEARSAAYSTDDAVIPATIGDDVQARAMGALQHEFTVKDLAAFDIGFDGVITVFYNNQLKAIARIELAVFDNVYGLQEAGDTSFRETTASGEGYIKKPGAEGAGTVQSGRLEMSNVNLAKEFSDMIVTQRGFQANSRMITVSDSMLEELVNLKR
ncbi:MAG: flagellar hook-basal body complex protein [Oscillospiraceae bacterium]|nr:flagellar hook-basal body complex protein [Oscillospiraceae bacterium]